MNKTVFLIIAIGVNSLFAQWTEIGPNSGWITCMESNPQNPQQMYCGVLQGGAFMSDDRGENWQTIQEIGTDTPVYDLSLAHNGIVYFASQGGLFISRDFGSSWLQVLTAATWQVFALNDSTVAADTSNSNSEKSRPTNRPWLISYNFGESWQFWSGTVDSSIYYPDSLYPHQKRCNIVVAADQSVFRTEGLRIFKTTNEDWTEWQIINELDQYFYPYCRAFITTPDSGATFYACAEYYDFHPGGEFNGGLFISNDGWKSWIKIRAASSATVVEIKDVHLFIGETRGESLNKNSTLILFNTNDSTARKLATFGGDIISIDAERWDSGELIVATEGGIYKSNDYGENWRPGSNGIHRINAVAAQVLQYEAGQEKIVLATHKNGIWSSNDDGAHWTLQDRTPYILPGLLQKAAGQNQYLYAGGFDILKSDDYGNSWEHIPEYDFPGSYYNWYGRFMDIDVDPDNPGHAIAFFFNHSLDHYTGIVFAETFDYGDSWTNQHGIIRRKGDAYCPGNAVFDSGRLWLLNIPSMTKNALVPAFYVIDSTWQSLVHSITLPDSSAPFFWCVNGNACYVINKAATTFYRTEDLGETWFVGNLGEHRYNRYYWKDMAVYEPFGQMILSPDKQLLFFVYPGTGVLMSKDFGETWETMNENLPSLNTYHLTFSQLNPNSAYLSTENGFYRADITTGVAKDDNLGETPESTPIECEVYDNYPNPFNPTTTINYQLSINSTVNLSIYNTTGQLVRTLVNEYQSAGNKSVIWNGLNDGGQKVSSGVYVYQIKTDNFTASHKMLLVQ